MNELTLEVLNKARDLITDPDRWTQRTLARDVGGRRTGATSSAATCFCALGALVKVAFDMQLDTDDYSAFSDVPGAGALEAVAIKRFCVAGAAGVNDLLGHDAVLKMFDHAIEMVQQGG